MSAVSQVYLCQAFFRWYKKSLTYQSGNQQPQQKDKQYKYRKKKDTNEKDNELQNTMEKTKDLETQETGDELKLSILFGGVWYSPEHEVFVYILSYNQH